MSDRGLTMEPVSGPGPASYLVERDGMWELLLNIEEFLYTVITTLPLADLEDIIQRLPGATSGADHKMILWRGPGSIPEAVAAWWAKWMDSPLSRHRRFGEELPAGLVDQAYEGKPRRWREKLFRR